MPLRFSPPFTIVIYCQPLRWLSDGHIFATLLRHAADTVITALAYFAFFAVSFAFHASFYAIIIDYIDSLLIRHYRHYAIIIIIRLFSFSFSLSLRFIHAFDFLLPFIFILPLYFASHYAAELAAFAFIEMPPLLNSRRRQPHTLSPAAFTLLPH